MITGWRNKKQQTEALAKLPLFAAGSNLSDKDVNDSPACVTVMDRKPDRKDTDSSGFIRTYEDTKNNINFQNATDFTEVKSTKTPVTQRVTGEYNTGERNGTRTRNLQIDSLVL